MAEMADNGITVLIVDDQDDIRVLVRALLERSGMSVVDDEDDIRYLVRVLLEREGIRVVDQALDGLDALITVARLAPPPVPTVIVLDHSLPGLTGLEVAERVLAQLPEQRIVLFSAYLDRDVKKRAEAIGVSACVAKTDILQLPDVISELIAA